MLLLHSPTDRLEITLQYVNQELEEINDELVRIGKELHYRRMHGTHSIGVHEHYCRRWVSLRSLMELDRRMDRAQHQMREAIETRNAGPDSVALVFTDTGVGMDDEAVRRAFEPYWRRQSSDRGT